MNRVPFDERRRLFLARQQANQVLRDQLLAPIPSDPLSPEEAPHRGARLLVKAVMMAMLVGLGLLVFQSVTFNLPTSVVEALLPHS